MEQLIVDIVTGKGTTSVPAPGIKKRQKRRLPMAGEIVGSRARMNIKKERLSVNALSVLRSLTCIIMTRKWKSPISITSAHANIRRTLLERVLGETYVDMLCWE